VSSRKEWSRRTEAASLALQPALLAAARRNSRTLADAAFLAVLAHEAAASRGAELTLAYRNVVAVAAGFRRRRHGAGTRLTREPCVVFIVRQKWARDEVTPEHPQQLPRWLVTFAEHVGQRMPFALATDVQHESAFSAPRAQGGAAVWGQRDGLPREHGALACAVDVHTAQGVQRCVLSALHVLTPRPDVLSPGPVRNLPVRPLDEAGSFLDQPTLATTLRIGGRLRAEEDPAMPSFDVQLARADLPGALHDVVGAPRLRADAPFVTSQAHLMALATQSGRFEIVVPVNHPTAPGRKPIQVRLSVVMPAPFAIEYGVSRGEVRTTAWIFHDELLKFDAGGGALTLPGDSGSPVVQRHADGTATLIGLHIGKADGGTMAIPAWRLFDLSHYWVHPPGATLVPASI
jgi:hypothetical protein